MSQEEQCNCRKNPDWADLDDGEHFMVCPVMINSLVELGIARKVVKERVTRHAVDAHLGAMEDV